jgi:thiamine-monophosphate kinase
VGEFELLAKVRERLPKPGPRVRVGMGDDAAVAVPGGATATSIDALVDGVHFRRERLGAAAVGRKALAAALSDLAAMGAEPGEAYLALGVPAEMDEEECLELLDGALHLSAELGVDLAGGDVTRAPALSVTVAVVGHAPTAEQLVTRAGARPGDALAVTGELGGAAAGLLLEERPELADAVGARAAERLRRRQARPSPRLAAGAALARAGAGAMIDLSDGLGADAGHVADASGVSLRIDAEAVPIESGVADIARAAGLDPLELATGRGEDYELLAALPESALPGARAAVEASGSALTRIGAVTAGSGVEIRLPGGGRSTPRGFDQLG